MKKTIQPFSLDKHKVYVFIEIKEGELSMSGVVGPKKNGDCRSCGQIILSFKEYDERGSWSLADVEPHITGGWNALLVKTLMDTWDQWRLNHLRAGCEHQRKLGWKSYDEHPAEPCPTCGYKYGTQWLKEELPQEVINFLATLPESGPAPGE